MDTGVGRSTKPLQRVNPSYPRRRRQAGIVWGFRTGETLPIKTLLEYVPRQQWIGLKFTKCHGTWRDLVRGEMCGSIPLRLHISSHPPVAPCLNGNSRYEIPATANIPGISGIALEVFQVSDAVRSFTVSQLWGSSGCLGVHNGSNIEFSLFYQYICNRDSVSNC